MQSRCTDCRHRPICKHKDEYEKAFSEITLKVAEPFKLTLDCSYYYSTSMNLPNWSTWSDGTNSCNARNLPLTEDATTTTALY